MRTGDGSRVRWLEYRGKGEIVPEKDASLGANKGRAASRLRLQLKPSPSSKSQVATLLFSHLINQPRAAVFDWRCSSQLEAKKMAINAVRLTWSK